MLYCTVLYCNLPPKQGNLLTSQFPPIEVGCFPSVARLFLLTLTLFFCCHLLSLFLLSASILF